MDIVTHAITGAASGAAFGHPLLGAFVGVLPDLVLPLRRVPSPNRAYRLTHALPPAALVLALLALSALPGSMVLAAGLAWLSHFVLDLPTHGVKWAPRPLYPFLTRPLPWAGVEWEWFSPIWWVGLIIAIIWIQLCLLLHLILLSAS